MPKRKSRKPSKPMPKAGQTFLHVFRGVMLSIPIGPRILT